MSARRLLRRMLHLISARPGKHSAAYLATDSPGPTPASSAPLSTSQAPAAVPVHACSVLYVDPPTLRLPRVPADERDRVFWDTEPVPLYILLHEQERARGGRR